MTKGLLNTLNTRYITATYSFHGLIGLANLLSAISCYKFHILINQQENIEVTTICHLAALLSVTTYKQKGGQMTTNCDFYVLLLIF